MTAKNVLEKIDQIAREFDKVEFGLPMYNYKGETDKMKNFIVSFAKFHVKEALQAAQKQCVSFTDKRTILSVYPESNIK